MNACEDTSYLIVLYMVPIFGIVFGTTLLFFLFYWWYRQRIEMIKAGLYVKEKFDLLAYSFFLGLVLTFVGAAITLVFAVVLGRTLALLGGTIPCAVGLGLLTYYKLSPKKP